MDRTTAAIVLIGEEILSGKVEDANARYLIRELRALGVELRRVAVIGDEVETIADEVRRASEGFDVVFTSGGVGPTHDDVTIAGVARAFGVPVVRDPGLERMLRAHFGDAVEPAALRMADVPEGAALERGEGLSWPAVRVRNVYVLPGIPEIFRRKFEALRPLFLRAPFALRSVYTRADESALAPLLDRLVALYGAAVRVGSYPRMDSDEYRVKVTVEGKDEAAVGRAVEGLIAGLPEGALVRVE